MEKGNGEGKGKMREKKIYILGFFLKAGSLNVIVILADSTRAGPAFHSYLKPTCLQRRAGNIEAFKEFSLKVYCLSNLCANLLCTKGYKYDLAMFSSV